MKTKIKIGDIFRIKTKNGFGYFQYTYHSKGMGNLIRVFPYEFKHEVDNVAELAKHREFYFVYFPLQAAVNRNLVEPMGNFPIPAGASHPSFLKSRYSVSKNGIVNSWKIIDFYTDAFHVTTELSEEERKYSPEVVWNDTLLSKRISQGWVPELFGTIKEKELGN